LSRTYVRQLADMSHETNLENAFQKIYFFLNRLFSKKIEFPEQFQQLQLEIQ
jgi:hypothetical protein